MPLCRRNARLPRAVRATVDACEAVFATDHIELRMLIQGDLASVTPWTISQSNACVHLTRVSEATGTTCRQSQQGTGERALTALKQLTRHSRLCHNLLLHHRYCGCDSIALPPWR